jgi:hypothetical protein
MTGKYVLIKTFKWMMISEDGLLKTPKSIWGDRFFEDSYLTEEEAVLDYQDFIDKNLSFLYSAILISEYEVKYVS